MVLPLTKGPGGVGFPSRRRGSLNGLFTPLIANEKPLARDSRHAERRAFDLAYLVSWLQAHVDSCVVWSSYLSIRSRLHPQ